MNIASLAIAVDSTQVVRATANVRDMAKAGMALGAGYEILQMMKAGFQEVSNYAREAVMNAARFETLNIVMTRVGQNIGYTGQEMTMFSKSLEKTGISMLESRNTLTQMASAQMDLTASAKLARIAQDAAVIGNINSSEAFQRMIYGIRSGQTEVLRTIGINVMFEQSYAKLAVSLGKPVSALTDMEKRQARTNEVVSYGTKIAGAYEASMTTMGKQMLSAVRYAEDLSVSIGMILKPIAQIVVTPMLSWLENSSKSMKKFVESADGQRMIDNLVNPTRAVLEVLGKVAGALMNVVTWVLSSKTVMIALAVVIGGILLGSLVTSTAAMISSGIAAGANLLIRLKLTAAYITEAVAMGGLTTATIANTSATLAMGGAAAGTAASMALMAAAAVGIGLAIVYVTDKIMGWSEETKKLEEQTRQFEQRQKNVTEPLEQQRAIWKSLAAERKAYEDARAKGRSTKEADAAAATAKLAEEEKKLHEQRVNMGWTSGDFATAALYAAKIKAEKEAQKVRDEQIKKDQEADKKSTDLRKRAVDEIKKASVEFQREVLLYGQGEAAAYKYSLAKKAYTAAEVEAANAQRVSVLVMKTQNDLVAEHTKLLHGEAQANIIANVARGMGRNKATELEAMRQRNVLLAEYKKLSAEYANLGRTEVDVYRAQQQALGTLTPAEVERNVELYKRVQAYKSLEAADKRYMESYKATAFAMKEPLADPFAAFLEARALADPTVEERNRLEESRARIESVKTQLQAAGLYEKAIQKVRLEQMNLAAEGGSTWAIIGSVVASGSAMATDSLVAWMNGIDSLKNAWKSLGDSLRNIIADMLRQMQKLIIQQQVMAPFLNALGLAFGGGGIATGAGNAAGSYAGSVAGAFSSLSGKKERGGDVFAGKDYLVGERGPEVYRPHSNGTIISNDKLSGGKQVTITNTVTVHVDTKTGQTSISSSGKDAAALGKFIGMKVREIMIEESRAYGMAEGG